MSVNRNLTFVDTFNQNQSLISALLSLEPKQITRHQSIGSSDHILFHRWRFFSFVLLFWRPSNAGLLIRTLFKGSTVPLAFVLWVLRELPPQNIVSRQEDTRRITYVNYETVPRQPQGPQQDWASATVSKNQVYNSLDEHLN